MKKQAKITKWSIIKHPFYNDYVLTGEVSDHPNQSDMNSKVQVTSPIEKIDLTGKTAETRNTVYTLLEQA